MPFQVQFLCSPSLACSCTQNVCVQFSFLFFFWVCIGPSVQRRTFHPSFKWEVKVLARVGFLSFTPFYVSQQKVILPVINSKKLFFFFSTVVRLKGLTGKHVSFLCFSREARMRDDGFQKWSKS